ncbi:hypothetical protein [Sphaerisporangium corydalis]|uniref:Uncharacterized protein n=1 Tax=Sphaerisporangium corydalis TaxID=1441875 RepID=A0ABV9EC18_9ACTN|nr:hypothetical protein [Sphaerisporangium corydalis]
MERKGDGEDATKSWPARKRILAGSGAFLVAVAAFGGANVLAPLAQRYVPEIGKRLDPVLGVRPVTAQTLWPVSGTCGQGAVAMPAGGRALDALTFTFQENPLVTAVRSGAASYEKGSLIISLRAREGTVAYLDGLQFRTLRVDRKARLDWILARHSGCGGGGSYFLRYDLDRDRRVVVAPDGRELPDSSPKAPRILGSPITSEKPLNISIEVKACHALYAWMVDVRYSVDGTRGNFTAGSPDRPLVSVGGVRHARTYEMAPAAAGPGRVVTRSDRAPSHACGEKDDR